MTTLNEVKNQLELQHQTLNKLNGLSDLENRSLETSQRQTQRQDSAASVLLFK